MLPDSIAIDTAHLRIVQRPALPVPCTESPLAVGPHRTTAPGAAKALRVALPVTHRLVSALGGASADADLRRRRRAADLARLRPTQPLLVREPLAAPASHPVRNRAPRYAEFSRDLSNRATFHPPSPGLLPSRVRGGIRIRWLSITRFVAHTVTSDAFLRIPRGRQAARPVHLSGFHGLSDRKLCRGRWLQKNRTAQTTSDGVGYCSRGPSPVVLAGRTHAHVSPFTPPLTYTRAYTRAHSARGGKGERHIYGERVVVFIIYTLFSTISPFTSTQ